MKKKKEVPDFVWGILLLGAFFLGMWLGYDAGFRSGQINYANGRIKYELKTVATGETVWIEIKKEK